MKKYFSNFPKLQNTLIAFLFLLPAIVIMSIFIIWPIIHVIYLSLHSWGMFGSDPAFIGLLNFKSLLQDSQFWNSIKNTVIFVGSVVPIGITISLLLALLVNSKIRGLSIYRPILFLPVVISLAAASVSWKGLYHPMQGWLNYFLDAFGIGKIPFLTSADWALPSIIIMSIWKRVGFNMLLFLAGLQGIPERLYEAADIDGANSWQKFKSITLPMLMPTTFFVLIITIIRSFQVFTQIHSMTQGGPMGSTDVIVFRIFREAFINYRMGYASSMAIVLFIIILIITIIQFKFIDKNIHYS